PRHGIEMALEFLESLFSSVSLDIDKSPVLLFSICSNLQKNEKRRELLIIRGNLFFGITTYFLFRSFILFLVVSRAEDLAG
ncbi:hypothetical protein, partial [Gracilibacillus oryzae]|uniref:hypothetical protein n=1 Tax=Gracilibacillus oryzae TaxID=1672701 RepID=UPI001D187322